MPKAVVVGAGPAGIAAATVLAGAGAEVVMVDEGFRPGGQIFRAPAAGLRLDMRNLLGAGFSRYAAFHAAADAVCEKIDYRPRTLVWSVHGGAVHTATEEPIEAVPYDGLVLATGATDRVMPLPGWTLPGVFTLGGAQALLKEQGCLIGRRTVFCGSSPLLYLAALQYLRMGGEVAAVIDTTPFAAKVRAMPDMLAAPRTLADGLGQIAALRRRKVPVIHGATLERFDGEDRVTAVLFRGHDGAERRIACDAVAYGHGIRPEAQLAELAGCSLRFDPVHRLYVPAADLDGRAGEKIYVAGDGAAIGGAEAARLSGTLAGSALARDLGLPAPAADIDAARRSLARLRRFQRGLATAFRWPREQVATLADAVILCRCESVTVGEVRAKLRQPIGASEPNRAKAASRCGMGRCQGRFCGPALAELTAADGEPGRLRAQAPIKPLPIRLAESAPL